MTEPVQIQVVNPKTLPEEPLSGERIPVGQPGDYKPCVVKLPDGVLLLSNFVITRLEGPGRPLRVETFLSRSRDGGRTWSERENLTTDKGLLGNEPYLTVLSDGTLFITAHMNGRDIRNTMDHACSCMHRSEDGGGTWSTLIMDLEGMKPGDEAVTTRNIHEMPDGSLLMGLGYRGRQNTLIWRSFDQGKTWPDKYRTDVRGLDESYPYDFYGEGVWWQARSGKLYLIKRIDYRFAAQTFGDDVSQIQRHMDQYDRMVLYVTTDLAKTLTPVRTLGALGEMYPSVLRLADGRLLFTFTVRTLQQPLGVRAIVGTELEDGFEFDFGHDRIMLDTQTAPDVMSGGGFGPTVQLDDGTLITSYSWRDARQTSHVEVIRWRLPEA